VRWSLLLLFLLLPAMGGDPEGAGGRDRLELREEGGEEVYVLVGSPVRLERDGEALEAERVVYFRGKRLLLLSGKVRYKDKEGRLIEAEELQVDLSDESFDALEVRIEAKDLLLTGPLCQRAAGAILLQGGYATPCASCGQAVPDYAFRAREIVLYPGDRVVARGVVLLVQEKPLLELPVLLLFLSERQPRLEVGQDDKGVYVKAALPYVSELGLGYTLLHYYGGRGYGFGLDHFGVGEARERYFFLHTPPDTFQYRGEYSLKAGGVFGLGPSGAGRHPGEAFPLPPGRPHPRHPRAPGLALRPEARGLPGPRPRHPPAQDPPAPPRAGGAKPRPPGRPLHLPGEPGPGPLPGGDQPPKPLRPGPGALRGGLAGPPEPRRGPHPHPLARGHLPGGEPLPGLLLHHQEPGRGVREAGGLDHHRPFPPGPGGVQRGAGLREKRPGGGKPLPL
jgi:hypothetical protein